MNDWIVIAFVDGRRVAELPCKLEEDPQIGEPFTVNWGIPEGQLRDGTYTFIRVNTSLKRAEVEAKGRLWPR